MSLQTFNLNTNEIRLRNISYLEPGLIDSQNFAIVFEIVARDLDHFLREQEIIKTSPHSVGEDPRNVLYIKVDCLCGKLATFYSQASFPSRFYKLLNVW